jgi:hypothetical protein
MRIRRFRLQRASGEEADWLAAMVARESHRRVERTAQGLRLALD